jgi:hypothetical protein
MVWLFTAKGVVALDIDNDAKSTGRWKQSGIDF